MMNQTTRLIIAGLLIGTGIALVILIAVWLPHVLFNPNAADEIKKYASWIVLTVNVSCFAWGLLSMSTFKVNIDVEIHQKGPLEKMILAAFLLDELGYKYAKSFIDKQFKITEENQGNNGARKKTQAGREAEGSGKKKAAASAYRSIEAAGNKSTEPKKT